MRKQDHLTDTPALHTQHPTAHPPTYPLPLNPSQVPEVQLHEPYLATSQAASLRATYEQAYAQLAAAGPPLHLVTYYDDLGEAYPWAVALPVAALSMDFLGVPGAVQPNESLELLRRHGWPAGKRLGAGVVDGRWAAGVLD